MDGLLGGPKRMLAPSQIIGGPGPPAPPPLPTPMNRIKPLNTMKRGVGILSPDKSMHLDLITKQDLLKVNNLQFRS